MKTRTIAALAVAAVLGAGCAALMSKDEYSAKALAVMKASFREQGQAKLDRLDQDEVQRLCSEYVGERKMPKEVAERIEKSQAALIKYHADGK
jgi:sulfur-oxidizing protein SoxX